MDTNKEQGKETREPLAKFQAKLDKEGRVMIPKAVREAFEALANAYDLAFLDEQRQEILTAYKLLKAALLQIDGGKYLPQKVK
ncbi:AbrB/MazE/SpoVT family DNA-binding domain-containing protein [Pyrococcus kukulkanii]|uniref:SpoVT-AbrB domain-containing protein n=1 Tax=Pyrococcus kukulkanii TaxID=1609559 RepID=A0A127B8A4_9EURY|nr:AbrB/MazE/SpoVT family DNA-binding domain-containing protein [Pyrococcus kukulkanii]AMM53498.1 hypothetical protein TQ32_02585 [Pyrococcus kukulkanii]